ncbi:MAG TPA: phosphoribosylformylglycinamidine cyclo-ligase [Smithella sp.]|nr:phosphoribosylformylglycinamidine cyclo-ligase [Smithella sp.]HOG90404.1 phosphoribosylformylglycinamidine cyclo-ligase [Smithella sp.]HQG65083.1 phosphoribosylformylglycinamidine cyclo-ligase [Smithella sp.]HQH15913.1 phosphoribosylformylglycinamidine cyclo-ligase [Smithella sp.]
MTDNITYKDAGVDIDTANEFVERIKASIKTTARKEVVSGIGGFGGLFRLNTVDLKKPVLVSSTDGVGTKLRIAQMMDKHDTIGIDLVAMSVNDVVVQGAEPLFFLDYLATGKIELEKSVSIVEGITEGCRQAGCTLLGGETAEMPGFYKPGEYDLAGFCVGVVESEKLITGSTISVNDRIIGIASSGLHSNGYSLARKVLLEKGKLSVHDKVTGLEKSVGLEMLEPTRIYVKPLLNLFKNFNIKGLVHITGGGFYDNIPRIIPQACRAVINKGSWNILPVFNVIQEIGNVAEKEMFRVFNMGIGMMIIVAEKESRDVLERLEVLGEKAYQIGFIEKKEDKQEQVVITEE